MSPLHNWHQSIHFITVLVLVCFGPWSQFCPSGPPLGKKCWPLGREPVDSMRKHTQLDDISEHLIQKSTHSQEDKGKLTFLLHPPHSHLKLCPKAAITKYKARGTMVCPQKVLSSPHAGRSPNPGYSLHLMQDKKIFLFSYSSFFHDPLPPSLITLLLRTYCNTGHLYVH